MSYAKMLGLRSDTEDSQIMALIKSDDQDVNIEDVKIHKTHINPEEMVDDD